MHVIRCAGCRRIVGYSLAEKSLRASVYCSTWCADEPNVDPKEVRNDEWRILAAYGRTPVSIARMYEISHSLVYRTLRRTKTKV